MKNTAEVLRDLVEPSNIAVHSTLQLAGDVSVAAAEDDKQRKAKDLDRLRRKPGLCPVPAKDLCRLAQLTTWDVLHSFGRAITLARRGAGRGLAEHWSCLKYNQALTGNSDSFIGLSAEGRETADYYKALQSGELGTGFALALAKRLLSRRYPNHFVSIVPADTALRAGWALTSRDSGPKSGYRYRPQFFAEVWRPGEPSRVFPIACKGNHSGLSASHTQLASASTHAEAVHIGAWDETPCLVFSTELPLDGPLTVHALEAGGSGGWLDAPERVLDHELEDVNVYPGIRPIAQSDNTAEPEPGYHVSPDLYGWFQHTLARTAAAGLTAFAGDTRATAPYLTKRQGQRHFTGFTHAATGSVQDARHRFFGVEFVGTDHVFRLNRKRVEAFSGVAEDLFRHLEEGRVEKYRREVYARRSTWPRDVWASRWDGPVSIHPDGSVLAMRLFHD
ncbi:hypothetical protein OHA98_04385 [Streptomyces sp. NBC_00654]|uniref:hypothetical protein n=1 Tax=Streptomyces sp. NBC_00654 TaxID=2975799 RepID=UPI0022598853|nr:hypothetical protein [Streptomyces sp. NBC_00654]MCX4964069.1 hypothetical protein [Streptomyces sp. NBC_00654]